MPNPKKPQAVSPKKSRPEDFAIGQLIRSHRIARGLSQTALADGLGVTFQQVQKYEKGVNRVSAGRLQVIAGLFKIPITEMMGPQPDYKDGGTADLFLLMGQSREGHRLANAFNLLEPHHELRLTLVALAERIVTEFAKA